MSAAFQNPLWGALAMILFGVGTLPSLTPVLLVSHSVPTAWRSQGTRIAGVIILLTGMWIAGRSAISPETCPYCRLGINPYSAEEVSNSASNLTP
jgi:sulfite exporter TauE/SafE